ncbi:hypothetical protein A7A08_02493 [Methyloligella halotolerans]|uniref:Pentapeptide MXKDX repeat protein n=1 Tax=Methyloligella halotolerans TaxID=1177755 RepID=A0A1E2RX80_9HYPH|nr:hypothetical protein [Methyloligella halotolerans]ODA66725.1 hypothetical protein A7A08_02493 [Methyloligella halotolerans]
MASTTKALSIALGLTFLAASGSAAFADHHMSGDMTKRQMKMMEKCQAMPEAEMMQNKKCMKLKMKMDESMGGEASPHAGDPKQAEPQ